MPFLSAITEDLSQHMTRQGFVDAYEAWESWNKQPDGLPIVTGIELGQLQATRDKQMRLVQDEREDWLCIDFAPELVDFTGFSIVGQLLTSGGVAFSKIHISNSFMAMGQRKPVFSVFKAIKATHITTWQALYLPVRSPDCERDEIIVILEPIIYRQPYLEQLINDLPLGIMTIYMHSYDGTEEKFLSVIEGNHAIASLFGYKMEELSGLTLEQLWPQADQAALLSLAKQAQQDGGKHIYQARLTKDDQDIPVSMLISHSEWGFTFSVWQTDKGMIGDLISSVKASA